MRSFVVHTSLLCTMCSAYSLISYCHVSSNPRVRLDHNFQRVLGSSPRSALYKVCANKKIGKT